MIPVIIDALGGWAVWAIGGAVALVAAYVMGGRGAKAKVATQALRGEVKAHERINNAETGSEMSDDQRSEWLREFAKQHKP